MPENNKVDSDVEIIGYLTQSGFTEEEIRNAMTETSSKDIDSLVNFIINANKSESKSPGVKQMKKTHEFTGAKEAAEMSKKRREELEKERAYKEKLIKQIRADMDERRERDRVEDQQMISSNIERTEDVSDCKIKLWMGDGKSLIFGFSKDDTIEDVFRKIENKIGRKGINLFRMNQAVPVERSYKKLCEIPELYPRGVLFVEE